MRVYCIFLLFLALAFASYSPINGCFSGDTFCADYTAPMCCNATASETCYQGYHSGICCQGTDMGCCGLNGNAAGGCVCRSNTEQCCGNYYNNVCKASETCCGDPNGVNTCCAAGTTCCGSACCGEGEVCNNGVCSPPSNCPTGKQCTSYGGTTCCGETQTCFEGYQSGVCCNPGQTGCCGYNGYALGGCICKNSTQQCCGNLNNDVCGVDETCCGDPNGPNTCCSSSETCANGVCVPKSGCSDSSSVCWDVSGTKCCDSTETCFSGYQSGTCCNSATESGCCGQNGYAIGGCKCRSLNQQCCNNLYNDVCDAGETCCGDPSGPNACCAPGLACCGGTCCAAGQVCNNGTCSTPSSGDCQVPNTICIDYGGSKCCTPSQTCHQGYHSGVCCDASTEAGCCGLNGNAIGGCRCRNLTQQCCGNVYNTICNIGETCCGDLNGDNTCCPEGRECCGSTCCGVGQICSSMGVCVSNSTVIPPPSNSTCTAQQTVCPDGSGTLCCDSDQSCFTGFQSGVCCDKGQVGCCGNNGFAIGGCRCRNSDETCCGNMFNTICGPNTCCCGNADFATCCQEGETCCFTLAEPLSNRQCCKAGDLCSLQFGCFTPNATTNFGDLQNATLCSSGATTTTTGGQTTGSIPPQNEIRKVVIENRGNLFKVISTAISSAELDNWDVIFEQFTGNDGIFEAYLSYFTQTNVNKSILDFKTRFYSIIEFVESGKTTGYQPSEDTLVQRYTLTSETWEPFNGPTQFNSLIQFNAVTSQRTIGISGYVSENIVALPKSNQDLTPDEIKFDVLLDFTDNYKNPNSQIALEARIKTWTKVAASTSDNFVTFFGDENAAASFSWVTYATAGDNTIIPVVASNLTLGDNPNEPEFVIYFTFATPKHTTFNWDPTVAVGQRDVDGAKSIAGVNLPFYSLIVALMLIICKYV